MAIYQPATLFTHVQDEASSSWTIVHGLHSYPVVDVYINDSGVIKKIFPASVVYDDNITCTLSFSEARSGFAMVI